MSSFMQIPVLARNNDRSFYTECIAVPGQVSALDLFDIHADTNADGDFKSTINPLAEIIQTQKDPEYRVDEAPLQDNGCLQLKMPILVEDERDMYITPPLPQSSKQYNNANPQLVPLVPLVSVYDLAMTHISLSVGLASVDRIVQHIQSVTQSTDEFQEVVQKESRDRNCLYKANIVATCFDEYGNHRFAKMTIYLRAVSMETGPINEDSTFDALAAEVVHIQGDTRLSMAYFRTVRDYILSDGDGDSRVYIPDFHEGFADMFEDVMEPEPNSFH